MCEPPSPEFQINFVRPDGEVTPGPPLILPAPRSVVSVPEPDGNTWDRDRSIREFFASLHGEDESHHNIEATMRALNRHDCWYDALAQFLAIDADERLGERLLHSFWITYGYWSVPRGLKGKLPLFVDVLRDDTTLATRDLA